MRKIISVSIVCSALITGFLHPLIAQTKTEAHKIDIKALLHIEYGLNAVPDMTPDHQTGAIFKAEFNNGNAHGWNVYLVLVGHEVVPITDKDVIRDSPFDGEEIIKSVRFARGQVDGVPRVLLLTATRDMSNVNSFIDSTPVVIRVYQIHNGTNGGGGDQVNFGLVQETRTKGCYINADAALINILGLGIPPTNYSGHLMPQPCKTDD